MHLPYSPSLLLLLLAIAFLGGAAKGLAGFGGALVMAPLCAMLISSQSATALVVFVHCATSLQGVRRWTHHVQWRRVAPFAATAVFFTFAAGLFLRNSHPVTLRHIVALCVLAVTALHMRGWRWRHDGSWLPTMVAGVLSGALTAIGGLGGPPAFYYLNGIAQGTALRANLLGYFVILFGGSTVILIVSQAHAMSNLATALLLVPAFACGVMLGERVARKLPALWMDRVVCVLLIASGAAALIS